MISVEKVAPVVVGVVLAGLFLYYFAGFPFVRESRAGFGAA